jgi:dTDP-4-amino-4,6-dideoxygalactose transaminase
MIPVTKTFLPSIERYTEILQRAWKKEWITNRGELVLELEEKLKQYLGVKNIIITNNGTLPLQIAIKAMALKGEIITTPFSYVATTASIVWENCSPVFVDIHPEYLTIDETKIEAAITAHTTAILATHVFGNPCHIEAIEAIAKKHSLKVIYDAAHCFGVKYHNESVFNFGDVSTCSFHATKVFHTGEGGAMFTNDKDLQHKLFYHHNFGHNGPLDFFGLGINAKISELQAAMGLAVYENMAEIFSERKRVCEQYDNTLHFEKLQKMTLRQGTEWNYSYYPVVFPTEEIMLGILHELNENGIVPRRYFYPSLNTIEYTQGPSMPVSESIAKRILCLPLYTQLSSEDITKICTIINRSLS